MNKNQQIIASSIFFVMAAVLIGYGLTAIDFAFGDDRWSRNGDRTSTFPLIGTMTTESAFYLGMTALASGLGAIIAGSYFWVANYSTIKNIWKVVSGILLLSWGIWGVAFSFNTVEWRIQHGIDEVGIPCPQDTSGVSSQCTLSSEHWLLLNLGIMSLGLIMVSLGTLQSRFVRRSATAL